MIDKETLRKLLLEAYSEGWHGSLELAEQTADEIVSKHYPQNVISSCYGIVNPQPILTNSASWSFGDG